MGWLRRWQRTEDELVLGLRMPHDAGTWRAWAAENGWSYLEQDPTLVGMYRPPYPGAEGYYNVLSATVHGRRVRAFERGVFHGERGSHAADGGVTAFVVVTLPGLPAVPAPNGDIGRLITGMGGNVPSGTHLALHGNDLVSWRPGFLRQQDLIRDADLLTRQINAVAPWFWAGSS
jgi:hypothetical protein